MEDNNYGNKDKLSYADLVFLQINRIEQISASDETSNPSASMTSVKVECCCDYLKPLIFYKLSEVDKKKFKEGYLKVEELEYRSMERARKYFDLLIEFLPKTNLVPGRRTTYETGRGEEQ